MPTVFLSYRRADSQAFCGRLFDRLQSRYGDGSVFMDIDTIPFGENFHDHIQGALSKCDVFLPVIGGNWSTSPASNTSIIDKEDFVRIEVEAAIASELPIIPILVGDARIPGRDDLPKSIHTLVELNAAVIDPGRDFHSHTDRLIASIDLLVAKKKVDQAHPEKVDSELQANEPDPFALTFVESESSKAARRELRSMPKVTPSRMIPMVVLWIWGALTAVGMISMGGNWSLFGAGILITGVINWSYFFHRYSRLKRRAQKIRLESASNSIVEENSPADFLKQLEEN